MTSKTESRNASEAYKEALEEEGVSEALVSMIGKINELHKSGGIETLFELVTLLHAMRSAASDDIVERIFKAAGRTTDVLTDEKTLHLIENVRESLHAALLDENEKNKPVGILSSLKLIANPESRKSLAFLLRFAGELEKRSTHR